jgi:4-hydroxy-tetrahydrodipicolinate reductase
MAQEQTVEGGRMSTALAIHGASGRMGQRLVALAHANEALAVTAALGQRKVGQDAGTLAGIGPIGTIVQAALPEGLKVDCAIDFSSPAALAAFLPVCVARRVPIVIATTGLEAHEHALIQGAAANIPVLLSPSMSLVVNLLFKLSGQAAVALAGKGFDVEIVERHHRLKKDSPSGTAVQFAKIVQAAMGQERIVHGREGMVGERPASEIGMHAIRGGDSVGEHTIIFTALGETMELVHKGSSRDSYARGALLAAQWLSAQRKPGLYSMADVLGL